MVASDSAFTSMVVDDLDLFGVRAGPSETGPSLRVDTNAVLAFTDAFQSFEPVARWVIQRAEVTDAG